MNLLRNKNSDITIVVLLTVHTLRDQNLLTRRKFHPLSLALVAMIAKFLNRYQVFKQNVQYANWYFVTHTKLTVVVPTSVTRAFKGSKMVTNPAQCAGKSPSKSTVTRT